MYFGGTNSVEILGTKFVTFEVCVLDGSFEHYWTYLAATSAKSKTWWHDPMQNVILVKCSNTNELTGLQTETSVSLNPVVFYYCYHQTWL